MGIDAESSEQTPCNSNDNEEVCLEMIEILPPLLPEEPLDSATTEKSEDTKQNRIIDDKDPTKSLAFVCFALFAVCSGLTLFVLIMATAIGNYHESNKAENVCVYPYYGFSQYSRDQIAETQFVGLPYYNSTTDIITGVLKNGLHCSTMMPTVFNLTLSCPFPLVVTAILTRACAVQEFEFELGLDPQTMDLAASSCLLELSGPLPMERCKDIEVVYSSAVVKI